MAAKTTAGKRKTQASDVAVGNRTLEGVLIELAERAKQNEIDFAERRRDLEERWRQQEERWARTDAVIAEARERSARAEEAAAEALKRFDMTFQTVSALLRDFHALVLEVRADNARTDARLAALEKPAAE